MILAVDIGNSTIDLGLFEDKKLIKRDKVSTKPAGQHISSVRTVLEPFAVGEGKIKKAIYCSVVPEINEVIKNALEQCFGVRSIEVSKVIDKYVNIQVDNPDKVGADRLVNAYIGAKLFKPPLIIVDFGTATTIDFISPDGSFLGGSICPGFQVAARALAQSTALLPHVQFAIPESPIGKNTEQALVSGIFFSMVGQVEEIIRRIKAEVAEEMNISRITTLATGGGAEALLAYCPSIANMDSDLILKGLYMIAEAEQ